MTKTQFEALKPGDVVANEFGWQSRIVRKTEYGWQARPLLGTGTHQELRGSKVKPVKIMYSRQWTVVSA